MVNKTKIVDRMKTITDAIFRLESLASTMNKLLRPTKHDLSFQFLRKDNAGWIKLELSEDLLVDTFKQAKIEFATKISHLKVELDSLLKQGADI